LEFVVHVAIINMAGVIRQPIDIPALQRYIEQHVPQIKTPLEVKQVRVLTVHMKESVAYALHSSASANRILHTS
jgi:hypothetical protein